MVWEGKGKCWQWNLSPRKKEEKKCYQDEKEITCYRRMSAVGFKFVVIYLFIELFIYLFFIYQDEKRKY